MWSIHSVVRTSWLAAMMVAGFVVLIAGLARPTASPQHPLDRQPSLDAVATLAERYLSADQITQAMGADHHLMATSPAHRDLCRWQLNVARTTVSLHGTNNAEPVMQVEKLIRLSVARSASQVLPDPEHKACQRDAAAIAGKLARAYHAKAAKTRDADAAENAERLYQLLVETFPDAADIAVTRFFYSELLFSRAESEREPRRQAALWERYSREYDAATRGRKEAASGGCRLAWKRELDSNVDQSIEPPVAAATAAD